MIHRLGTARRATSEAVRGDRAHSSAGGHATPARANHRAALARADVRPHSRIGMHGHSERRRHAPPSAHQLARITSRELGRRPYSRRSAHLPARRSPLRPGCRRSRSRQPNKWMSDVRPDRTDADHRSFSSRNVNAPSAITSPSPTGKEYAQGYSRRQTPWRHGEGVTATHRTCARASSSYMSSFSVRWLRLTLRVLAWSPGPQPARPWGRDGYRSHE